MVVAHNLNGIVARVKCRTCGSEHKYHPEKKKSSPRVARTVSRTLSARKVPVAPSLEEFTKKLKGKEPIPYGISGSFNAGDVIGHPKFGMGLVTKLSRQRIEVLFLDGPKTLACDM